MFSQLRHYGEKIRKISEALKVDNSNWAEMMEILEGPLPGLLDNIHWADLAYTLELAAATIELTYRQSAESSPQGPTPLTLVVNPLAREDWVPYPDLAEKSTAWLVTERAIYESCLRTPGVEADSARDLHNRLRQLHAELATRRQDDEHGKLG